MIHHELESALNEERIRGTSLGDTSKGLCEMYEDRPISERIGIFTVVFAEQFCKENPGYTWRAL
jgi:hypothetical protein